MSETQLSTEHRQALEAFVALIETDQEAIDSSAGSYINAMVSGTYTVGPAGGHVHGWITFTGSGKKIQYQATKITDYWGLAAQAAAVPLVGALDPDFLNGKTGRFEIQGVSGGASLQAWVDGRPVFKDPIPFLGTGLFGHGIRGEMKFTLRD